MVSAEVQRAARQLRRARTQLDTAMDAAKSAALAAIADGEQEKYVALELGVNRLTVRRWQGK